MEYDLTYKNNKINFIKIQMENNKHTFKVCSKCAFFVNTKEPYKFCSLCGNVLIENCLFCGKDIINPYAKFCKHCGKNFPWKDKK